VPPEFAEIVHRAIEIRADARYESAAAMLDAITRIVPAGALEGARLASSGGQPRPVSASTIPPSPRPHRPRFIVAPDLGRPLHANDATTPAWELDPDFTGSATLLSAGRLSPARSAFPEVGPQAEGRYVTVDPRRLLGEKSELWTFSLDVHRHVSSLIARIWRALRRAGGDVPPMTYGTAWVLVEARTGRAIAEVRAGLERLTLEDAGLRPGSVLWVVAPAAHPRAETLCPGV